MALSAVCLVMTLLLMGAGRDLWPVPAGGYSPSGRAWVWLVTIALLLTLAWTRGRTDPVTVGLLAAACALWWAPILAGIEGTPTLLGQAARAAPLLLVPLAPMVIIRTAPARACSIRAHPVSWVFSVIAYVVASLAYDPFLDLDCFRTCQPGWAPLAGLQPWPLVVAVLATVISGASGLIDVRERSGPTTARWFAVVLALAGATWVVDTSAGRFSAEDVAAILLGGSCAVAAGGARSVTRRRRRVLSALEAVAESGSTADVDPALFVGADMSPEVELIRRTAELRMLTELQSEEIRASCARIVADTDAEQRAMARDLHDTVQQRVVGGLLHLQAASSTTSGQPDPDGAEDHARAVDLTRRALANLRAASRDPFPESLDEPGAFLEVVRDLVMATPGWSYEDARMSTALLGPTARRAVYAALATGRSPEGGRVTLSATNGWVRVVISPSPVLPPIVEDRITAAGGSLQLRGDEAAHRADAGRLEMMLPCES